VRNVRPGQRIRFPEGIEGEAGEELGEGRVRLRLRARTVSPRAARRRGRSLSPLHREGGPARARGPGALPDDLREGARRCRRPDRRPPLHPAVLDRLRARGVDTAYITLIVGYGTFQPVRAGDPREHRLHAEAFRVGEEAAAAISAARARGGRVVAVGTTVVRTLEACAAADGSVRPGEGRTDLYILPGHPFRAADAILTNFHLPRSTLLMLVAAFAGARRSWRPTARRSAWGIVSTPTATPR